MTNRPLLGRLLRSRPTFRQLVAIDIVVAVLLTVRTVAYLANPGVPTGLPWWLGVVLGCVVNGGVALRRYRPMWTLVIVTAATALSMLADGPVAGAAGVQIIGVALVMYTVAATRSTRPAGLALIGVGAPLSVLTQLTLDGRSVPDSGQGALGPAYVAALILAAWSVGRAARASRAYRQGRREQAAQRARAAAEAERLTIARELHDVVAHAMSVIAVQAGVGRYVIHEQPHEAEKSLAAIETTSRGALADMRRLLGVLRESRSGDLLSNPGIADLPELVEQARQAGLAVDLTVRGVPEELPTGLDLVVFRIVQEALTNIMKHAATDRGWVEVCGADHALRIEVTDNGIGPQGSGDSGGHGLIGMRERVNLYGGRFEAGPLPRRGFRIAARLPL